MKKKPRKVAKQARPAPALRRLVLKWGKAHRYKSRKNGNWEIDFQYGDGSDFAGSFSLNPNGELSFSGWMPPGSGFNALLGVVAEANHRIALAKYSEGVTVTNTTAGGGTTIILTPSKHRIEP